MDTGSAFIAVGVSLLPIIVCWLGLFTIRYSVDRLKPSNKKTEALKVFTSTFAYVCAILWTIICAGVGYASYRVFNCIRTTEDGFGSGVAIAALILYLIQLILYWSWMPLFIIFDPCIGIVAWIAALLTAVGCALTFGLIDLVAGLIFIPYIIYQLFFSGSLSGLLCVVCSFGMLFDFIDKATKNDTTEQDTEQTTYI